MLRLSKQAVKVFSLQNNVNKQCI